MESQYVPRNDTIHCFHMQKKESTWDIFEIQTANNVAENVDFNFSIYKNFSYLLSFANSSSTKFMSAFASFLILNIFNVSFYSSLNRLNAVSPYQKCVQTGDAQNLGSGFIQQSCVVEINTAPQHNW